VLAPVGDVDAMANGAIALMADDKRYQAASAAARARAGLFAIEKIVPMYERVYAKVTGG